MTARVWRRGCINILPRPPPHLKSKAKQRGELSLGCDRAPCFALLIATISGKQLKQPQ
jgi:hypothetical protein